MRDYIRQDVEACQQHLRDCEQPAAVLAEHFEPTLADLRFIAEHAESVMGAYNRAYNTLQHLGTTGMSIETNVRDTAQAVQEAQLEASSQLSAQQLAAGAAALHQAIEATQGALSSASWNIQAQVESGLNIANAANTSAANLSEFSGLAAYLQSGILTGQANAEAYKQVLG
jgi:hypothetical protein